MNRPRILIVDDEQHIVSLLSMTLRKAGYEVISANHTAKAIDLANALELKLVILDHALPSMDEKELSDRLTPDLPVLMVTSKPQIFEHANHRIDQVIHTPFSPRELVGKVREMIGPGIMSKEQTA